MSLEKKYKYSLKKNKKLLNSEIFLLPIFNKFVNENGSHIKWWEINY